MGKEREEEGEEGGEGKMEEVELRLIGQIRVKEKETRSCRLRAATNNNDYASEEEYTFSDSDDKEWLNDGRGNAISTSESKDLGKIKS